MSRYPQGVQWLYKLLFSTQFTKDRLKVIAMKMLSSASKKKRDGNFIAKSLINDISFTNGNYILSFN